MENTLAHASQRRPMQRLLAIVMALVLAMGLMPHAAWADDAKSDGHTIDASLILVHGIDYNGPKVLVNKHYTLVKGATVADLFQAAKDAGDIKDYEFKDAGYGSYISSVTLADGTVLSNKVDWSSSWSNYKNGVYDENGSVCKEGDAVSAGDALEFAYADAVAYGNPTTEQWNKLAGKATVVKPATAAASKYDAVTAQSLVANLSARYVQGGKDASISNDTVRAAIALNALGLGASIDADAIVSNMENYKSWDGKSTVIPAGTLGKYIMALTAAGIDCTSVKLSDGKAHNLVSEMEQKVDASTLDAYSAVCILPVYQYGSYTAGADAPMSEGDLIEFIASQADAEGLIPGDTQTTAQAIQALAPYAATNATAKKTIDAAVKGLLAYQNADGGFGYSSHYGVGSLASNVDATADIVCALVSLGYDCATGLATANGSTPLSFLESKADADLCGYLSSSNGIEVMTSAGVLAAFVAQANSNGGAYNIYTLNKVLHADDANVPADSDKAPAGTDAQALAQTGDSSAAAALALCAIAGAAGIVASRRKVFAQVELSSETESKVTK